DAGRPAVCGRWKRATGNFVREIEKPGTSARFSPDGRWIVGPDAIVDAATGKALQAFTFGKRRIVSPGGTLIAAFDEDQKFRVHEARTGQELLARDLGPCKLTGKIIQLSWHPAENRITGTMGKRAVLGQVARPQLITKGIDAEARRTQATRVAELRRQNAKAEPMKVEWK